MHKFNHNYFKTIDTEEKAYILGFLYADGYNSDKQVVISQLEQDVDILEKINKALDADNQIKRKLQSTNNKTVCQLCYSSIDMCTDLTNLGCFRNKSLACTFPTFLDKSLVRHFIRGYFDGDGCFTWHASAPNLNNRERNWRIKMAWQIDSKTQTLLTEFQKWFETQGVTLNINYIKRDNMYRLCTTSKKTFNKIYDLIFKKAQYSLSRKINKINHYVNTEVTQLIAEYRNAQEVNVNESNNPPKSPEHASN